MVPQMYDRLMKYATILAEQCETCDEKDKEKYHKMYLEAMERIEAIDKDEFEYLDKEDRRRIEEERNQATADVEKKKLVISRIGTAIDGTSKFVGVLAFLITTGVVYNVEIDGRCTNKITQIWEKFGDFLRRK